MTQVVFAEGGSPELRIRNSIWCRVLLLVFDKASLPPASPCRLIAERYEKTSYSHARTRSSDSHHTYTLSLLPSFSLIVDCEIISLGQISQVFVFKPAGSVCIWRSSTVYSNNARPYTICLPRGPGRNSRRLQPVNTHLLEIHGYRVSCRHITMRKHVRVVTSVTCTTTFSESNMKWYKRSPSECGMRKRTNTNEAREHQLWTCLLMEEGFISYYFTLNNDKRQNILTLP